MTARFDNLPQLANEARSWLLDNAAPLWSQRGRTSAGLFAERITLAGEPDESFYRTFVQARHIYSFVTIGSLGWSGPWEELVAESMDAVLRKARRLDGLFVHRLDTSGAPVDPRADLYDQAFVLFALAAAGKALGRPRYYDEAETLLDRLDMHWRSASEGFNEGEIVKKGIRRQNPHMHLLEAAIALYEASGRDRFKSLAVEIAELAIVKFIEPESGAIIEYFSDDLAPAEGDAGRIVEPGHCFEWAWLFEQLSSRGILDCKSCSDRLVDFARANGLDERRGIAINELYSDGSIRNGQARLWPQTERLRAAAARYRRLGTDEEVADLTAAAESIFRYLDVPIRGLWRDKLNEDGEWVEEMSPGSSLYHIAGAINELTPAIARAEGA